MAATFVILKEGREVLLRADWVRSMGFKRGRILRLLTPLGNAISDGGTYRIQRLDGTDDLMDLQHDLHRTTFIPTTPQREAKRARVAAYRAAQARP